MKRLASLFLFFTLSSSAFAQIPVKEDTAREFDFWFFDAALGTNETGLTVTSIVCRTVKNGVTTASFNPTASGGSNDMVELGHGGYRLELTAAQLDTAGSFTCACSISGSVSSPVRLTVIPAASYELNYEGNVGSLDGMWEYPTSSISDVGSIGKQIKDSLDTPISAASGRIEYGTAQAGAANTITLQAAASGTANFYRYKRIVLLTGTGAGQSAIITAYNQTTKVATIVCEGQSTVAASWFTNPDSTTTYVILPRNR